MKQQRHTLRTGWRGTGGMESAAETFDQLCRMVNGLEIIGGDLYVDANTIRIRVKPTGSAASTSTPWRRISTAGQVVTIASGDVLYANAAPVTAAQTNVTITGGTSGSPHYVVLEYTYGGSAQIVSTSSAVKPQSEPGIFRCALASYYVSGGSAVLLEQRQSSDIIVPGWA